MNSAKHPRLVVWLIYLLLVISTSVRADGGVAVFYPDVKEPYLSVFQQIVSGIRASNTEPTHEFKLDDTSNSATIRSELAARDISRVITLGQSGYRLAETLHGQLTVVCGALPMQPNGVSGISLTSDPQQLFHYLKQVAPEVTDVHVAYSEKSRWLIERATRIANSLAIRLHSVPVADVGEATRYYQALFSKLNDRHHSVWLTLDRVASDDQVVLPLVLREAWQRQVVVFSSTPAHAKRGVLFSTYPDNVEMGEQLLQMVNERHRKPDGQRVEPLKSLQLAVNLRTAARLGLHYSASQMATFSLTFP